MGWLFGFLALFGLAPTQPPQHPPPPATFLVVRSDVVDEKAVSASIEPSSVVPARARISGTILELKVRHGDRVEQGEVLATVADRKLDIEVVSSAAQVKAAQDQLAEAKLEYDRAQHLTGAGIVSRNEFDQDRTAYNVAVSSLKSVLAQRAVVEQQITEGKILAPVAGRVVAVPVTTGTVVMAGDPVATVAEQNFVLRLDVPERHARFMKIGDRIRIDGEDLGLAGTRFGTIVLIYPKIDKGRVVADAAVSGLKDDFVGERIRVWVPAGERDAIVVPQSLIVTRFGIDYARLWTAAGGPMDVPVQRGQAQALPKMPDGLEILSGLRPGDRLVRP